MCINRLAALFSQTFSSDWSYRTVKSCSILKKGSGSSLVMLFQYWNTLFLIYSLGSANAWMRLDLAKTLNSSNFSYK